MEWKRNCEETPVPKNTDREILIRDEYIDPNIRSVWIVQYEPLDGMWYDNNAHICFEVEDIKFWMEIPPIPTDAADEPAKGPA